MEALHLLLIAGEFAAQLTVAGWIVVRKGNRPAVATSWIVVVMTLPVAGILAYLLMGEIYFGRRRMKRHAAILQRLARPEFHRPSDRRANQVELTHTELQVARMAELVSGNGVTAGNRVSLSGDTDRSLQMMVEEIDRAASHVHLLTYIYLDDAAGRLVGDALCRAAARGVPTRLLVDGLGSRDFLRSPLAAGIRSSGVTVVEALPINPLRWLAHRVDVRNHRKLLVVDGNVAFTGSQNIAAKGFAPKARYAPWVDCLLRIEGPLARELQLSFVEDWSLDHDESLESVLQVEPPWHSDGVEAQTVATGPNFNNVAMTQLVQALAQVASQELILTTPYFVPDNGFHMAMVVAARRGVSVHLVVPRRNDSTLVAWASRSHYQELLEAGVRIHEFQHGLLHAKTITVDRALAVVMTANLDRRSFEINFEQSVLIYDRDFTTELRRLQESYMTQSTLVDPAEWARRHWSVKLRENTAGLLSPLL